MEQILSLLSTCFELLALDLILTTYTKDYIIGDINWSLLTTLCVVTELHLYLASLQIKL